MTRARGMRSTRSPPAQWLRPTDRHAVRLPMQTLSSAPSAATRATNAGAMHYPLSPAQWGIWMLEQREPHADLYTQRRIVRLAGSLDRDVLERSLQHLALRHDAFRARF